MNYRGYIFKKPIQIKVYKYYLQGLPIELIGLHLRISDDDVNDIIDYINELYH